MTAYLKYADRLKIASEIIYSSESSISIKFDGKNALKAFEDESGKHVVQRVPITESKGRRHTSVVSVAVMEMASALNTELDLREVDIMTQRSSGPGGQNVNKVESSVRAVHKPTGITVRIDSRDQSENKKLALEILAARVFQKKQDAETARINSDKKNQLGAGDRSGKIRTYNWIDKTVTDHRTGIRTSEIKRVMKGDLDLLKR